ncbi:MAG: hypothetical protein WKF80_12545 [Thermomicrobiales bacterium]
MATQTMPYAACAGNTATIDLRYDDQTNVVTAIVATNASGAPVTFAITDPGTGASVSRTWQTGTSETVNIPGNVRFDVDEFGALAGRFGTTFSGPAMAV